MLLYSEKSSHRFNSFDLLVGEVYIKNEDFDTINENRRLGNETVFSTARNAAAGSLRNLGEISHTE